MVCKQWTLWSQGQWLVRVYPLAQTQQSTCAIDWQAAREERFPRTLLTIGSGFKLQYTKASRGLDYARILNSIAELRQVNQPPARHHLCYSEASKTLIWTLQMMFVESGTHRKRLGSKGVVTDKVKLYHVQATALQLSSVSMARMPYNPVKSC